eukprot:CAMPEP_0118678026 /NCGR_PEP_ID=MMETSP0800-20121206/2971_1 /TAXON_ID=210618 ORGANISM="Striatella unipunctata, Strain CCMP2910" /NCGR_SAMPLE_ID=MMETSP0800 /ASSEMBLY_ACC=CAM_ASM_000638 /LENGTH=494 /DNA_ID=CAMNT_0006573799 /DNA_START=881 /DNA_END=2365 /DNA_ORIENTATION=+
MGEELGTFYSKSEMRKLLELHADTGQIDKETATAMTGALKYKDVTVQEVMTPLDKTFMINVEGRLNFESIAMIFKTGYSRIPVYEVSLNNIIGLLFVKDLIFVDPEDEIPIRSFVQIFGRGLHVVWPDDRLGDVLRELKKGRSHMAVVREVNNENPDQDPFYEIKGIVTLEDIIEEIIGEEIVDETDEFVDGTHLVKVNRNENFDWGRLSLLDAKIVEEKLSFDEIRAVTAHLRTNHNDIMKPLTDRQLWQMVTDSTISEFQTASQEIGKEYPDDCMYEKDLPTNVCTLILSGKITVVAGNDNFRCDLSSWAVLAASALNTTGYAPDFSAFVSVGPCRCIRFSSDRFDVALDASTLERRNENTNARRDSNPRGTDGTAPVEMSDGTGTIDATERATKHRSRGDHRTKLIAALKRTTRSSSQEDQNQKHVEFVQATSDSDQNHVVSIQDSVGGTRSSSRNSKMSTLQLELSANGTYQPGPIPRSGSGISYLDEHC